MSVTSSHPARPDVRARIIDAAADLVRRHGAAAMTTRAVAEAAGVQAPTIYRLFGDKDGLVDAVAESVMSTYVSTKAATMDDESDPVAALRSSWQLHIEFGLANAELYAVMNGPGRRERSTATAAGVDILRTRIHRLAAARLLKVSERRALDMIRAAGDGTILVMLTTPLHARDPGLPASMLDAVMRSILEDPGSEGPASAGGLATTVAFATGIPELPALSGSERALLAEWVTRSIAASEDG